MSIMAYAATKNHMKASPMNNIPMSVPAPSNIAPVWSVKNVPLSYCAKCPLFPAFSPSSWNADAI